MGIRTLITRTDKRTLDKPISILTMPAEASRRVWRSRYVHNSNSKVADANPENIADPFQEILASEFPLLFLYSRAQGSRNLSSVLHRWEDLPAPGNIRIGRYSPHPLSRNERDSFQIARSRRMNLSFMDRSSFPSSGSNLQLRGSFSVLVISLSPRFFWRSSASKSIIRHCDNESKVQCLSLLVISWHYRTTRRAHVARDTMIHISLIPRKTVSYTERILLRESV